VSLVRPDVAFRENQGRHGNDYAGGLVTLDPAARWQRQFKLILDPDARTHQHVETVDESCLLPELARRLRTVFDQEPQVDGILVRVKDVDVGIATRATAGKDPGHAGVTAGTVDPGAGDGATLPGLPGEFRPVRYKCKDTTCTDTFIRTFHDERRDVRCPQHGPTEYKP
jgi:hypothetical protein